MQVQFISEFYQISGYAYTARSLALALHKAGIDVRIPPYIARAPQYMATLSKEVMEKLDTMSKTMVPNDKSTICFQHLAPQYLSYSNPKTRNIIYTTFESNSIPYVWPYVLKKYNIEEIWVPGHFNYETFKFGGIPEAKLRILNHGHDPLVYNTSVEPIKIKNARTFKFLCILDPKESKGLDVLLKAYFEEFSEDDDVSLIVKATFLGNSGRHMADASSILKTSKLAHKSTAQALVSAGNLTDDQLASLHKTCDCFVLATRGEGWCHPILHSMVCGTPAIISSWGGQTEYANKDNSLLIEGKITPITNVEWLLAHPEFAGQSWFEPSVEDLRKKMRWAYEHPQEMKQLGAKAAKTVAHLTWDLTATRAIEYFKTRLPDENN